MKKKPEFIASDITALGAVSGLSVSEHLTLTMGQCVGFEVLGASLQDIKQDHSLQIYLHRLFLIKKK